MKNPPRFLSPILTLIGCALAASPAAHGAEIDFQKGDHIVYIGNTLPDRMQHDAWLETLLQSALPELELVIRNQGFSGDQVADRPRNKGFTSPEDYLKLSKADVIFVFFGYNESFADDAGLAKFQTDLAKMIDRKSFMLGMMTAFGECIAGEAKKCAFSPPFYPEDYFILKTEAERIADELGISLWLEQNEEIVEENRVMWWVMYKFPEILDEYHHLRAKGFNPAYEFDRFSSLLSYGYAFGDKADQVPGGRAHQEGGEGEGAPTVEPGNAAESK